MKSENLMVRKEKITLQGMAEEIALLAIEKRMLMTVYDDLLVENKAMELTIKTITEELENIKKQETDE